MKIINAKTFKQRLIGLAFKKDIDYIMKFENCNSIHTFFMRSNIDVYLVDENDIIKYIYYNFKKNKIIFPKKGVKSVYETKAGLLHLEVEQPFKKSL